MAVNDKNYNIATESGQQDISSVINTLTTQLATMNEKLETLQTDIAGVSTDIDSILTSNGTKTFKILKGRATLKSGNSLTTYLTHTFTKPTIITGIFIMLQGSNGAVDVYIDGTNTSFYPGNTGPASVAVAHAWLPYLDMDNNSNTLAGFNWYEPTDQRQLIMIPATSIKLTGKTQYGGSIHYMITYIEG